MKNDIDAILESMFRDGKLRFGGAVERSSQAQRAIEKTKSAGDNLSKSLESSIEQLTQAARADIAALDKHLEEDGLKKQAPAGNQGPADLLETAFEKAVEETRKLVVGQEDFVSDLAIAFKRPFVAGYKKEMPMARVAVAGKSGTGKHMAIETMVQVLHGKGVLKSPKTAGVNLSRYGESGMEKTFVQDVFAALKSGASALLFDGYEGCSPAVLSMVSELFRCGSLPLAGRYAEQKGMLVDIGTALVPGAVSSLPAAGKFLFLVSDQSVEELAGVFGAPFLASLDDICETISFTGDSLQQLSRRALEELCRRSADKLGIPLTVSEEGEEGLCGKYKGDIGAPSLYDQTDRLYRALGEYKLKHKTNGCKGQIAQHNGELAIQLEQNGESFWVEPLHSAFSHTDLEQVKAQLHALIGLQQVKEYILSLEDNFKIQQLRREKGLVATMPSMHMIFTGNPGTGKTTVARIVAKYLKAIGVLEGGQLVEVSRADLVGKYVGHTAPLTQKAIQAALGGVLFIDEAYALYRGGDDSFGLECIDTLVKEMEDHRDNLVVVLAGYSKEMESFLAANSGLRSRFPNMIEFPDYSGKELLEITEQLAEEKGYHLDDSCREPLESYYTQVQNTDPRSAGNGRLARNKVEEAILACSRRTVKETEALRNLELLLPEDFNLSDL